MLRMHERRLVAGLKQANASLRKLRERIIAMDTADKEFGRHNAVIEMRRAVLNCTVASVTVSKLLLIADYKLTESELRVLINADTALRHASDMLDALQLDALRGLVSPPPPPRKVP